MRCLLTRLLSTLLASVARGSTAPKAIYTDTLGLLWIPFLGAFLTWPLLTHLRPRAPALACALILVAARSF